MNQELKQVSEKFIYAARERLEVLYLNRSTSLSQISRLAENARLWQSYLENEANPEGKKFVDELNSSSYNHISEEEKIEVNEFHREALQELIMTYNRKILLNG